MHTLRALTCLLGLLVSAPWAWTDEDSTHRAYGIRPMPPHGESALTDGRHLDPRGEDAAPSEAITGSAAAHRPLPPSAAPGSRALAGPPGTRDPRIDLSEAHFLVRAFSVDSAFGVGDAALARALDDDSSLTTQGLAAALARYDAELSDVDALRADRSQLGAARVQVFGSVALIQPGTGEIAFPTGVEAVVVDLRHLPARDELREILPRMVAPALTTPVEQPLRTLRRHEGPIDEWFSATNVYRTQVVLDRPSPLPATGARDLPIVLIVGERIAPQAAEFAVALRAAGRAWILGNSLPLAVAETTWRGVGDFGLAVRTSTLLDLVHQPPTILPDQVTYEDDNWDPTELSYRRAFTVEPGTTKLTISTDGPDGDEALIVVLRDANRNGVFEGPPTWVEFYAYSDVEGADETLTLASPPAGDYQIIVWAYYVPAGAMPFTLSFDTTATAPLPDEVQPDLGTDSLGSEDAEGEARFEALLARVSGATPPPLSGAGERTSMEAVSPFRNIHPKGESRGEVRASLIAIHGFLRHFFRYLDVVGDSIDERLFETLALADAHDGASRLQITYILRRFGEAIHDGHQFVGNYTPVGFLGNLPVFLEHPDLQVRPVVRRSRAPGVNAGDTIVALEGRPIEEVYAEELARTSAASLGYKYDLADRLIYRMLGPLTLTLEDPDGALRTVTVPVPGPNDYADAVFRGVTDRPNGPLTDLGAPDIYYLNVGSYATPSTAQMVAAIAAASRPEISGMVLDVRGFPSGFSHYELALRLIPQQFHSPLFEVAYYTGPDELTLDVRQHVLRPQFQPGPRFHRPIVLLTGPHAVSGAENFMQMLVGANRLRSIVGHQPSAATNGNITGLQLPGGFYFSYTGMKVRNPDGSRFHGIGIVPDVFVPLTAADLRDGIDREILAAIDLLR